METELSASSSSSPLCKSSPEFLAANLDEGNVFNMLLGLQELDSVASSGISVTELQPATRKRVGNDGRLKNKKASLQEQVDVAATAAGGSNVKKMLIRLRNRDFDSTSSAGSGTNSDVEVMSDYSSGSESLQALMQSRSQSPLCRSMSSTSLVQLHKFGRVGDSLPCTQSAPLDSSTLKIQKPLLQDIQRTSSLPNLASLSIPEKLFQSVEGSPLASPLIKSEGANKDAKVGKYSEQERKVRLERYRKKRSERNFQKKIKVRDKNAKHEMRLRLFALQYACRKHLADSRPRIRGRFAKNDEVVEKPKLEEHEVSKHDLALRY